MTYNKTLKTPDKIVFEKESQTFSIVMKVIVLIGTGLWAVLNLAAGVNILTTVFLFGVMAYLIWVVYIDYVDDHSLPQNHTFLLGSEIFQIEMDDHLKGSIP